MNTTIKAIAEAFSQGSFAATYQHFSDHIQWQIIGDKTLQGKDEVIAFCNKMLPEIAGNQLNNTNVLATDNQIAIEGNCQYTGADNQPMQVQYCDLYSFNNDKLDKITSYCITSAVTS